LTIPDVLARLRAATAPAHERLEADLDLFTAIATPRGRRRLVRRFHGLHSGAEAVLAPWLGAVPGLDFQARRRRDLLAADLAALGEAAAPAPPHPAPTSLPEALGQFYVLEGSTLGGQVIRKRVLGAGGTMQGLSFLDPYGAETGPRWKSFLGILDRECQRPARAEAAVRGGLAGFEAARRHLCAEVIA
jgi:heme oxygenase